MASEKGSAYFGGLPAGTVTGNTNFVGYEAGTPNVAKNYAPTMAGAASSPVATDAEGQITASHFLGSGTAPTVAGGTNAGSGGSFAISVTGTDAKMQVTLTCGNGAGSPTNAPLFVVTFAQPFATAPYPVMSPCTMVTAGDMSSHDLSIAATTTTLTVSSAGSAFSNGAIIQLNIQT
jgi:hypothetical protein